MSFCLVFGYFKHAFDIFFGQRGFRSVFGAQVKSSPAQVTFRIVRVLADEIIQQCQVFFGCLLGRGNIQVDQCLGFIGWKSFLDADTVQGIVVSGERVDAQSLSVADSDGITFLAFRIRILLDEPDDFAVTVHDRTTDRLFGGLHVQGVVERVIDGIYPGYGTVLSGSGFLGGIRKQVNGFAYLSSL